MKSQKGGSFLSLFKKSGWEEKNLDAMNDIRPADAYSFGAEATSVSSLLQSGKREARSRQIIYDKWAEMESNPFVSTSIALQVTSALGGHETTGEVVFVERKSSEKDAKKLAIADELSTSLAPLLNKIAYQMCYTGTAFGDAYVRLYSEDKVGVVDAYVDELVRPPLVQPYERGSQTKGFTIMTTKNGIERLSITQMARLKLPRINWVPQHGVVEKSMWVALTSDNIDDLPLLPSMAGGSLLYTAEDAYDNLTASLTGLVGQRWMDSIDEQIVTLNMTDMTADQQQKFAKSVVDMMTKSKKIAEDAVRNGKPFLERVKHILPVWGDKQVQAIEAMGGGNSGRASSISIEDVMLHARSLAGALGTDLSMLGFADQLSGGLGDGGFFRVSAQSAERSRIIRIALTDCFNWIADIHTFKRYGFIFPPNERPWNITYYGTISALDAEKSKTQLDSANSGLLIIQAIQQLKDAGASKDMMLAFLRDEMMLDEDKAKVYVTILDAKPEADPAGGGGGF